MMVNVISGGDTALDALLYRNQSPMNGQFIWNQLNNITNTLTDVGKAFMDRAKQLYDHVNSSEAMRIAQAALKMSNKVFSPYEIYPLQSIDDFQSANLVMQRYIMACPEVRTMYQEGRCNGYEGTYTDLEPKAIGIDHYDYQKVMDGVLQDDPNNPGEWMFDSYAYNLMPNDVELTVEQQYGILDTWELAKLFTAQCKDDFTNPAGGML